jgi:hypothetical protein
MSGGPFATWNWGRLVVAVLALLASSETPVMDAALGLMVSEGETTIPAVCIGDKVVSLLAPGPRAPPPTAEDPERESGRRSSIEMDKDRDEPELSRLCSPG